MTISNIQKRKFLQNLNQLMYSSGVSNSEKTIRQPREEEIKKEFDEYFSANRLGLPLSIDVNALRNIKTTDPDFMNFMLTRSIMNIEVLYDSVFENNDDLMKVVTILNRRLEDLKSKRVTLESKVDDILFSISNSDGFFYSFTDNFSTLDNVDLNLTSCFVDTENKKVTLSKLKSSPLNFSAPGVVNTSNIKYSIVFNGNMVVENAQLEDANNLFDGLSNTQCAINHRNSLEGICALVLTIPISTSFVTSKVQGRISSPSPITTIAELTSAGANSDTQYRRKQSNSDYDNFSFDFIPQTTGNLRLTFIKYSADSRDVSSPSSQYLYTFNLRDLIVSGEYYDSQGTLVSSPISIPAGNENKVIDSISVDAKNANPEIGNINFFVARNVEGALNISDFDWIPLSSTTVAENGFDKIINFNSVQKKFKTITSTSSSEDSMALYPISSQNNLSTINPSTSIYSGINTYRIAEVDSQDSPYNSYILDSVNRIQFYYVSYVNGLNRDRNQWSSILSSNSDTNTFFEPGNIQITNTPSIPVSLNLNGISGYMKTNLICDIENSISTTISRSDNSVLWDMSVYLNGVSITTFESGVSSKDVVWNLRKGINIIEVTFDAVGSSSGSISLMSGESINAYGTPFLRYYSYVDPFDFKSNRTIEDFVFTIDNYLGNKEILSRQAINENSRFVYYNNSENPVSSVRFRADLSRFNNPFGTPSLNNYRIKFKNSF